MLINFTKMQGLGNDFMVLDNTQNTINLDVEQIVRLSNRHFGVGFVQLLLVELCTSAGVDFSYRIYNADGSEVAQCGNGARCFARFVHAKGLTHKRSIVVQTRTSTMTLTLNADDSVRVNMGKPVFEPEQIVLNLPRQTSYQINNVEAGILSMGNPHCVLIVEDLEGLNIAQIAQQIQQNPVLPNGANVGFMQILNKNEIILRVYERGAGETLACGSGACAAVVYGVELGLLDNRVVVHLNGGDAIIEYEIGRSVFLSGSAEFVFEGQIEL
jgi:diaminopimelate epimerase